MLRSAMSAARTVTAQLKKQLYPRLIELGFEPKGRTATRVEGPVTAVVAVNSFNKWIADSLGVSPSSFSVALGIDYLGAQPIGYAGHLDPWVPDIAQTRLQAHLSVTDRSLAAPGRADVWVVDAAEFSEGAVADVVVAFEQQAVPLLAQWCDLDIAYTFLRTAKAGTHQPGDIGRPGIWLPGNPGSIARHCELATLAAHRGAADDEIRHLTALLALTPDERYETRLRQLSG